MTLPAAPAEGGHGGAAMTKARPAARFAVPRPDLLGHPIASAFARFLAVGCLGLAVDVGVFSLLDARATAPEAARAASLGAALVVTWTLNRRFTFAASGRKPGREFLRYGAGALAAQGLSYAVFLLLVYRMPALPRLVDLLVGAGLAAFLGFASHSLFAFARVGSRTDRSPA